MTANMERTYSEVSLDANSLLQLEEEIGDLQNFLPVTSYRTDSSAESLKEDPQKKINFASTISDCVLKSKTEKKTTITAETPKPSISIQTCIADFRLESETDKQKTKKIKKKNQSTIVKLPDSHLTLRELLQQQRKLRKIEKEKIKQENIAKNERRSRDTKVYKGNMKTGRSTSEEAKKISQDKHEKRSRSEDALKRDREKTKSVSRPLALTTDGKQKSQQRQSVKVIKDSEAGGEGKVEQKKTKHDYSANIDIPQEKELSKDKLKHKRAESESMKTETSTKAEQKTEKSEKINKPAKSDDDNEELSSQETKMKTSKKSKESEKQKSKQKKKKGKGKKKKDPKSTKKDSVQEEKSSDEKMEGSENDKKGLHEDKKGEKEPSKSMTKKVELSQEIIELSPLEVTDGHDKVITDTNPQVEDEEQMKSELKPPGEDWLVPLEGLLADQEVDKLDEIPPEMLEKVEEQIFDKIKYYKEVKANVRIKTWFIRKKITLRGEANAYITRFEGNLASGKGGPTFSARMKISMNKLSRALVNYMAMMVPWEAKIKNIECYFGSVVASYFTFLRWLFYINFMMALICSVVIMMPEIMFAPGFGSVDYKSLPDEEMATASYFNTLWNFDGFAKVSPLFYGYYSSMKEFDSGYRMPFAYLVGNLMMFGYSFITILRQIAANSKDEKASDKDDNFTFSWKTFASWDYMIGNAETAKNKYKSLVLSIRESITDTKEKAKKISSRLKFFRFFANILTVIALSGGTYLIYMAVSRSQKFEKMTKELGPGSVTWLQANEVSLSMTLVTTVLPTIFDIIASLEDYHPRIALQMSLRRLMILYLLNLYTLYIALFWKIQDIQAEADLATKTFYENLNMSLIIPCPANITNGQEILIGNTSVSCGIPKFTPDVTCWETMVGQELIKLTWFDLVTTVWMTYLTEFVRACVIRLLNTCWCWDMEKFFPGYVEFSLADNLLHLIYNQGMIWMGTLFCPALPALNLIKLLSLFYVRSWSVMVCNVPEERIFKAGSANFYLMLLLLMLYVVMIPIAFAMVTIRPSRNCGPYRETEYMYLIITEWLKDVLPSTLFAIAKYIASPGALIPIFILLFLCIYYLNSSNNALQGTVLDLKKQLAYERKEGKKKLFNLNKVTEAPKPIKPKIVESQRSSGEKEILQKMQSSLSLATVSNVSLTEKPKLPASGSLLDVSNA